MKKIGVTGAAGFVGSHLCERLLAEDYEVVGVDDLSYGSMANMEPFLHHRGFTFEVLDCTQRRPLRAAFDGCDAIMHLAAKKIPRYGGTLATLEVNVTGVNAACSVALALDADVIVTSTSDVYGDGTPPYREDGQLVIGPPTSKRWAYAVSKMYDEHHALALADERDLKVTILRLFNVYGPRNHLTWWGGPTVTFIESLLDGEPVEIHGDGLQTRSFTYVEDTVEGFMRALQTPESRGEVINVGSTDALSIRGLAETIQERARDPAAAPRHVHRLRRDARQLPGRAPPDPGHDEGAGAARLRGEGLARGRADADDRLAPRAAAAGAQRAAREPETGARPGGRKRERGEQRFFRPSRPGWPRLSCLAVWPACHDPVEWTPDALYYQARVLELRGEDNASNKVFHGPLAADLRARDPGHTGNEAWVEYNEPFYERRVAVPLAAAALYPVTEERSLLDLSLVGYVAAVLALFGLLLLRFRIALAAAVAAAAALLPPLTHHSSFPLTDSWGLALEIVALGAAILSLERGLGLAAALDRRDRAARVHARQHVDPDPRRRLVRTALPLARAGDAVRDRRRGGASRAAPLHDPGARAARAARERLRAFGGHLAGIHREPLPGRARRAVPRERRLPSPRRVVHGALPRRRRAALLLARLAPARRRGSAETTLMTAAAVLRARLCPRRARLQRLPARARLRADGRVRASRSPPSAWRSGSAERDGALARRLAELVEPRRMDRPV